MKISRELEIGKAGEYLAVYSITKQGYVCYLSDQGLPYDIVVDVNDNLISPNKNKGFTHRFIQEYSDFTNMLNKMEKSSDR